MMGAFEDDTADFDLDQPKWEFGPIQAAPTICDKCGRPNDEHPNVCPGMSGEVAVVSFDIPRAPKWKQVEPGTVIPAGQPYRFEYTEGDAYEKPGLPGLEVKTGGTKAEYFVDSSWKPPPALPTEPCVIRAKVKGPVPYRVLFGHPNPGEEGGMTFCRDVDGLTYKADEIESFEVLWREGERGKDVLVPWEAIDKLRDAYPSDPGAFMTPVDFFLREVVGDR